MVGSATKITTADGLTLAMDYVVGDDEALASAHIRRLRNWLAQTDDRLALAATCTGTFVLADAVKLSWSQATMLGADQQAPAQRWEDLRRSALADVGWAPSPSTCRPGFRI